MTGLIYVAIIAVWAVVLVPAWLRRHDHQDPGRSIGRFSRAMDTLANGPGLDADLADRGYDDRHRHQVAEPIASVQVVRRPAGRSRSARRPQARPRGAGAAMRRRAVLMVLGIVLVAVCALALLGSLPTFMVAAPLALICAFLVASRVQVRRGQVRRSAPGRTARAGAETGSRATADERSVDRYGIRADGTWEATSTPLPNYLTAPAAAPSRRVIDTESPGAWTAAAMLERAQQEKQRQERMEQANREAMARAQAEQAAAESRSRDDEYLAAESSDAWFIRAQRRRAVNE